MNLQYDQLVEGILGDLAMKGLKAGLLGTAKATAGLAAAGLSTAAGLGPQGLYGKASNTVGNAVSLVGRTMDEQKFKALKNKKLSDIKNPALRTFYNKMVKISPENNGIVGLSKNTNAYDARNLTIIWLKGLAKLEVRLDGLTPEQETQKLGTVTLDKILARLAANKRGTIVFKDLIKQLGVNNLMTLDSFNQTLGILLQDNPTA